MPQHLLIIGGSDAGISAALRARELAPDTVVTMLLADAYPNFSICGIPFYISREVANWENLAHRTVDDLREKGIRLRINEPAVAIDPVAKKVRSRRENGLELEYGYDRLIVATGARSVVPKIEGVDQEGVFTLRWIGEMRTIDRYIEKREVQSAVVVGGGYIGLEMADALTLRGIRVSLVEFAPTILTTVDPAFGRLVQQHLEAQSIEITTDTKVEIIKNLDRSLSVQGTDGFRRDADMVLVAVGATPEVTLAREAGIELGPTGAIRVDRFQATNLPDIYAAGDCTETWHQLVEQFTYLPLGTTAHKQGRIAGENAVGGKRRFQGSIGTQSIKLFDRVIARTGLHDRDARQFGLTPYTVASVFDDHKAYYPGATSIHLRITGDAANGRLLGVQLLGSTRAEISKRVDIAAAAIYNGLTVAELSDLDLSYTPPLSSPWDPLQMAAQVWERSLVAGYV